MNNSNHFQVKQEERPAVKGRFNMFGTFDQNLNFDSHSIMKPMDSSSSGIISSNESFLTKRSVNEEDNGFGLSLNKY